MSLETATIDSVKTQLSKGIKIESGNGITQQIAKAAGIQLENGKLVSDKQTRSFLIELAKTISTTDGALTPSRPSKMKHGFSAAHTVQEGDIITLADASIDAAATLAKVTAPTATPPARLDAKTDPRSFEYEGPTSEKVGSLTLTSAQSATRTALGGVLSGLKDSDWKEGKNKGEIYIVVNISNKKLEIDIKSDGLIFGFVGGAPILDRTGKLGKDGDNAPYLSKEDMLAAITAVTKAKPAAVTPAAPTNPVQPAAPAPKADAASA